MEVLKLIFIIIFYILSCYGTYKFVQIVYSKNGRWSSLNPDAFDLFMTFMPVLNTYFAIEYLFGNCYKKYYNDYYDEDYNILNKFYRISK